MKHPYTAEAIATLKGLLRKGPVPMEELRKSTEWSREAVWGLLAVVGAKSIGENGYKKYYLP